MNRLSLQSWLLRMTGLVEILAFVAVVMPRSWMEISHAWLGLGEMPGGIIIMFLIRQSSYTYGVHGISLWILASDVIRFRPLIRFNGVSYLIASPVFFVIDYTTSTPFFWTVIDTMGCAFIGGAILLLDHRDSQLLKQKN